ncbi:MAG: response regulator [Chloroflexota bacterium]
MQAPKAVGEEQGPLILVVEDDRPTRELLAAILTEEGLPFHVTCTGHEAMEYAREHPPSMVVLDMHLPNLRGEAVATALRIELGQALPILAMSASNEWATAGRIGAYGYVPKPFEVDAFVSQVRQGLDLAERAEQLRQRSLEARARVEESLKRQRESFEQAVTVENHLPGSTATS